jgi:hypothetical protein
MTELVEKRAGFGELILLKLAREIAMDIRPVEEILEIHKINSENWENIQKNPYFQGILSSEVEAWQSANNTSERLKIKSLAMVEEALPEFYARMHDPKEPLPAKTDVLKTIAKFAGVGGSDFNAAVGGERLSVTINLGADHQLRIEKEVTSKVIDHEDIL